MGALSSVEMAGNCAKCDVCYLYLLCSSVRSRRGFYSIGFEAFKRRDEKWRHYVKSDAKKFELT